MLWRLIWPQVEVPRRVSDQENLTPRRVLDQQGSNDFAAYMQEHAGSPMFRWAATKKPLLWGLLLSSLHACIQ